MFDDLVAELHHAVIADMYPWDVTLYVRAADEIERLREELKLLKYSNEGDTPQ